MTNTVISVEHLSKQYDLGVIGTGTISRDINRWWHRLRGKSDPYTRIGEKDAFAQIGESILALNDVSFTVQQGQALGIIGRNGAGKSTLLKILSRVTAPTSGLVKVKGRIGSLLEVGIGFHNELTGRENIFLNGAILGMKKAEVARKFDEIVDFAGVEKFIDTPVKRYSSGMYVRLAFAVAAHLDPEILIVDEVLAVGDAEFQKKCLGKMGDVAGEGRTVLFVSHNMTAIQTLCPTSLLLASGKIKLIGQSDQIVDIYLNEISQAGLSSSKKFLNLQSKSPWLEEVTILINDKPGQVMAYGDELSLECKISCTPPLKKPSLGMVISSVKGESILNFNNLYLPFPWISTSSSSFIIRCRLGTVPLMEGHYLVSIWFGEDQFSHHEFFENILGFEVVSKDIWNQGTIPTRNISDLWWPAKFEFYEESKENS